MPSWNKIFDSIQPTNAVEEQKRSTLRNCKKLPGETMLFISRAGSRNQVLRDSSVLMMMTVMDS